MAKDLLKQLKNSSKAVSAKVAGIALGGFATAGAGVQAFAEKAGAVVDTPGHFMSHVVSRVGEHAVNYPTYGYRYGYGMVLGKNQYGYGYSYGQIDHYVNEEYTYKAVDNVYHWLPGTGTSPGTCFQIGQEGAALQKVSVVSEEVCKQTALSNGLPVDPATIAGNATNYFDPSAASALFNASASTPEGMYGLDQGVQIIGKIDGDVVRVVTDKSLDGIHQVVRTSCESIVGNVTRAIGWDQGCSQYAAPGEVEQRGWQAVTDFFSFGGNKAHGELASPQLADGFNQAASSNTDFWAQVIVVAGGLAVLGTMAALMWRSHKKNKAQSAPAA